MRYIRLLLFPLSLLYGLAIAIRHLLYDRNWMKRTAVDIPTIVVGNLAVGGTGKSPMVEYLVRALSADYRIAVLSRGYGRRTKGYREVHPDDDASLAGDEPLQFKRKFPDVTIAVCENRVAGIRRLEASHDLVLLDDAFQHRALVPGFAIVLFDFTATLRDPHFLLPAGNYRDLLSRRRHADVMVVTKTPQRALPTQKDRIARKLAVGAVPLLYASIQYDALAPMGNEKLAVPADAQALVVTGIANPAPFVAFASQQYPVAGHVAFPDHHAFTKRDREQIVARFEKIKATNKILVTTEKDAMRLRAFSAFFISRKIPVYYVPIRAVFEQSEEELLLAQVRQYLGRAGAERHR